MSVRRVIKDLPVNQIKKGMNSYTPVNVNIFVKDVGKNLVEDHRYTHMR